MTTDTDAIRALLEKVEAGMLPSLLDREEAGFEHQRADLFREAFNGSLDAAKTLHEAVLPERQWNISLDGVGRVAKKFTPGLRPIPIVGKCGRNPARAWLIAILRTLLAQEGE